MWSENPQLIINWLQQNRIIHSYLQQSSSFSTKTLVNTTLSRIHRSGCFYAVRYLLCRFFNCTVEQFMDGLRPWLAHKVQRFPSVYPYPWWERNWISQQNLQLPEYTWTWLNGDCWHFYLLAKLLLWHIFKVICLVKCEDYRADR